MCGANKMSFQQPKCAADLYYSIKDYGEFKQQLKFTKKFIINTFANNASNSLIIRGKSGCGKTTLVDRAIRKFIHKMKKQSDSSEIIAIKLNGYIHTSDASTIQSIGSALGLQSKTIQEIVEEVQNDTANRKIIIVLDEFDQFCRRQQTLLYNLFHLNQLANHVCIIAITNDLDCMESLEKRVRSRVNATNIELGNPYNGRMEYLEFASALLGGGLEIDRALSEALMDQYDYKDNSIRQLKHFLVMHARWDDRKKLSFVDLDPPKTTSMGRLTWLTKSQLELIILAVCYCVKQAAISFNCKQLMDHVEKHNIKNYDLANEETIKNLFYLNNISLISPLKPNSGLFELTLFTQFTLNITASELSLAMSEHASLRNTRTELFWDKLKF